MDISRREFLQGLTSVIAMLVVARVAGAEVIRKIIMSNAEWKKKLTPEQFSVLREEGTERAFTSELNKEHRKGTFYCAACHQELFSSDAKYDSGTGWPSFYEPIHKDVVETTTDHKLLMARTEVRCAKCDGHLGHVFEDGPKPTGLRYCMNGVAMTFKPK